jgi:predicted Zn-dependent protease
VVRARQGDSAAAQAALTRAVGLDPTHWGVSLTRADLLGRTSAKAAIDELLRLRSVNPKFSLGQAKAIAGRFTQDPSELARLSAGWK